MTESRGGYPVSAKDMTIQFGIGVRETDEGGIIVTTEPGTGVSGESWVRKDRGEWIDIYRGGVVDNHSSVAAYQGDITDAFYG